MCLFNPFCHQNVQLELLVCGTQLCVWMLGVDSQITCRSTKIPFSLSEFHLSVDLHLPVWEVARLCPQVRDTKFPIVPHSDNHTHSSNLPTVKIQR